MYNYPLNRSVQHACGPEHLIVTADRDGPNFCPWRDENNSRPRTLSRFGRVAKVVYTRESTETFRAEMYDYYGEVPTTYLLGFGTSLRIGGGPEELPFPDRKVSMGEKKQPGTIVGE